MSTPIGSICHIELYANDLEEASYFYRKIFDWTTTQHDMGYIFWKDPGGMTGGFTTAGAPVTNPSATFYIKVNDIKEMLEKISQNGGVVIREKTEISGENGFYSLFRDPSGNNVGLWSSK